MQRDKWHKGEEKKRKQRLSEPETGNSTGEMERVRSELARLKLQVAELSAAFDRQ